jgi:hypothetical protein
MATNENILYIKIEGVAVIRLIINLSSFFKTASITRRSKNLFIETSKGRRRVINSFRLADLSQQVFRSGSASMHGETEK